MNDRLKYYLTLLRRKAVVGALIGGAIVALSLVGLVRFLVTPHDEVHYHANVAVFINGQREEFRGAQYYQEVAACDQHDSPLGRVHLHDKNSHVVHVHDSVVTWGELFMNLGWSLNNSMVYDGHTPYINGQGGELHFILNDKPTRSIANEIIGDRDRLLISYGTEDDAALQKQFSQVESDAKHFDETADPAACQGPHHEDIWTRLRQAFFF
jgi:hypothetical protein